MKSVGSLGPSLAVALSIGTSALAPQTDRASELAIGPKAVQQVLQTQLFTNNGRWFLLDDGPCYAFLETPVVRLGQGRLLLDSHLSSRLGQRIGNYCAGAGFASAVTFSAALVGQGSKVTLSDIRIDHVDDGATRDLLSLLQRVAPQALPQAFTIDVLQNVRGTTVPLGGYTVSVKEFAIQQILTSPQAIAVRFDLSLAVP
jgi:hypothetical protein